MKKLLYYLRPHAPGMAAGFAIKVIGTLMDLVLPWILAYMIDEIVPRKDTRAVIIWGLVMAVCSVIAVAFNIRANRMASRVAGNCVRDIRHDLYARISYLDSLSIDAFTISSLESRLTSDTYYVHQMLGMMQRLGVRAPILLIGGMTVTFLLDVRLSLIMVLTMPAIALTIWFFSKRGIPLYTKLQQSMDTLTGVVRENASGIRIIKALRKSEYEKRRFDRVNREAIANEKKAGLTMAATNPLVTFFLNVGLTAVIVAGAHFVSGGQSSAGKIIAFMSYFTIISNAMINLSRMFVMISKGSAGMNRIERVLDTASSLYVADTEESAAAKKSSSAKANVPFVEFRSVGFSYDHSRKVLDGISFTVGRGETLGVIGPTGSGKSSIISLLLRTYDPDEGEVLIDGEDIREMPTSKLRKKFGVVFQNDFLFADSIRENVSFCRDLSDEQIEEALTDSQAIGFVSAYEDGFSHPLEIKGANLSGGQKQRVLIARALASDPDILILDDSSSALDYKTDASLRKVINEKYAGVTKIIIAQRISSIMHADRIIVLEKGKIVGTGTHSELIKTCELYRETAGSQIGGLTDE